MSIERFVKVSTSGADAEQPFLVQSTGAADGGRGVATDPATGKFHPSVMPDGVGADVGVAFASGAIGANKTINVFDDAGTVKVRLADASSYATRANGFTKQAYADGEAVTYYKEGTLNGLSGLTVGAEYFQSDTTPGAVTSDPVTAVGHILQSIGTAISATEIDFEPERPIIRA